MGKWYNGLARYLMDIHDNGVFSYDHVQWWVIILTTAFLIRIVTAPFMVRSAALSAKMGEEELNIRAITNKFQKGKPQMSAQDSHALRQKINAYYRAKGINPLRTMVPTLIAVSFFFFFVFTLFGT